MRCAAGAGADAVVIAKRRSAPLSATARKAASGAAEYLPLVSVTNIAMALEHIAGAGLTVIGAAADAGISLYGADLREPHAIVLGGEARGLRRLTREKCDRIVSIPLRDPVQSLNVSAAAAVFLFEAVRQRSAGPQADRMPGCGTRRPDGKPQECRHRAADDATVSGCARFGGTI